MKTLGIDLAAQPKNTAAVVVDWVADGGVCRDTEVYQGLCDDDIVGLIESHPDARVGIDAPFGWPVRYLEAIQEWDRAGRWPAETDLHQLRFRETDRFLQERVGWYPLSVSTDLISIVAFRCSRLLSRLAGVDGLDSVVRMGGQVVEVYPAAALARWELPHKGYKGVKPPAPAMRERIRNALVRRASLAPDERLTGQCVASDHCLDALVCALVARAAYLRLTESPRGPAEVISREGWIELPTRGSLDVVGRRHAAPSPGGSG